MTDDSEMTAERGQALLDLGRDKDAESHFRAALARDPGSPDLHVLLAHSLHRQQRYAEAKDAAEAGLAADPEHLGAMLILSASLAGLKDLAGALRPIRRALQLAPGVPDLHRQEGAILIAQDRSDAAVESLARARTLDPEDSDVAALQAAAFYNVRRFADAEQAVSDALALDPDNAEAHRIRGLLRLRRGGGRDAVDAHQQALRLDPTEPEYREGLSVAMKSRNPLYGWLLAFSDWQRGLPGGARWAVFLAPFVATRVLRPFDDELWARIAIVVVFALVLLTWTLEPVMNTVLLCSRYARNLLPRDARLATYAFLAYLVGALACAGVNLSNHSERALVLALGMAIWSVSAGQTHLVDRRRRKLALALQAGGGTLTVAALTTAAFGAGAAPSLSGVLVVTGVLMLWFTSLA